MVDVTHEPDERGQGHVPVTLGRRRPTGEPPALPRHVSASTRVYVALAGAVVVLWAVLVTDSGLRVVTGLDLLVLRTLDLGRSDSLDRLMRGVHALGSVWTLRIIGWPTLVVLIVLRRIQRLVSLLAVTLVVVTVDAGAALAIGRMRPADPSPRAGWSGYAHPSMAVVLLGLAVVGALYNLVPAGRWRNRAAVPAVGAVVALGLARIYLAVDHPTDVIAALVTGVAVPVVGFRLLAPDDVVPVRYRRGRAAHLDVSDVRRAAIATATREQMGLEVVDCEPFALSGSAGSTPLRLVVRGADGVERTVFGKLYATVHLRSDRWYKLARAVTYGRLEDERPFNAVRRLVEYEDHMLRFARDAELPTAAPYGVVEITPEREYLLVTEFLAGAEPIGRDNVDESVIDSALAVVRRMWDAGIAHRDIKPANLLVRDGEVLLIDLAFAAVRPSPWRQAVDLANMMVTLALFTTPEHVYERASRVFTPDEIAEAFAASRGVTIPSQLRTLAKHDGRHVASALRALAPPRPAIAIQRWTVRRVGLTIGVAVAALVGFGLFVNYLSVAGLL